MYGTMVRLENLVAWLWSFVQQAGSKLTISLRPKKFPYGYEDGSRSGTYLKLPPNYQDLFVCQLYDVMMRDWPNGNLAKDRSVLEVECDAAGGISYVGQKLEPKLCMATTNEETEHELVRNVLNGAQYVVCPNDSLEKINKKFDVVLCVSILG